MTLLTQAKDAYVTVVQITRTEIGKEFVILGTLATGDKVILGSYREKAVADFIFTKALLVYIKINKFLEMPPRNDYTLEEIQNYF